MLSLSQIVVLLLVAVAMACSLGHALELPGKLRLSREHYLAVQTIYYPGFTVVGGFSEILGLLGTLILSLVTPRETAAFAFTVTAAVAMVLMHAVFWLFTQPVNKFWLRDQPLGRAGAAFFRPDRRRADGRDWTQLRDQWERSHVVRAALALVALAALAAAVAAT
jgi:hypothetical protein